MSVASQTRVQAARLSPIDAGLVIAVLLGAVLRFWDLGHAGMSIDETYTALAARLPLTQIVPHIDATDPHGPLPYLLLQPIAGRTVDVGVLRAVSALASTAAVGVFAIWQRGRGIAGLVAVAVFALAPYQLVYGRQVRMYGLLSLGGVAAAYCAARWLESPRRRWAVGAVAAGLIVAFSHAIGILLLLALMAIPLLSRSRAAWEFRAVVAGGVGVFAVTWGAHALVWSERGVGYPTASPDWVSIVLNETIAAVPDNRWLVVALLLTGGVVLVLQGSGQRTVWLVLFVLPVVVLTLASLRRGVLVPRSLMPFAWGGPLALGALAGLACERSRAWGATVVVLLAVLCIPAVSTAVSRDEGTGVAMASVREVVGADGIVFMSDRWQHESLVEWYQFASLGTHIRRWEIPGGSGVAVWDAGQPPPARFWLFGQEGVEAPALEECGPTRALAGGFTLQCVELDRAQVGSAS